MTSVEHYIQSLVKNKPRDEKTGQVNVAALMRLQGTDIPMVTEMVRTQEKALKAIVDMIEERADENPLTGDDAKAMYSLAFDAYSMSQALAASVSHTTWGQPEGN